MAYRNIYFVFQKIFTAVRRSDQWLFDREDYLRGSAHGGEQLEKAWKTEYFDYKDMSNVLAGPCIADS